ncbi:MAG: phosphatidylserine decarboxylase [Deltaproteobacteria bacterium]|nr:phosphatidylserine decarboxylase [Deltaproteobacteria bacterium]MBU49673.1 phosphatidylserine decarboxylase [Deltaproteobacteria bacterium]|tara:strand:+ start:6814 stop:7713 length:900 start_codon:yes stop_codon:yes gene_type:complete
MFFRIFLRVMDLVLPERMLSRLFGVFARLPLPAFLLLPLLRWYVKAFDVEMSEARYPLSYYGTFVEFFTRPLKEGVRHIDEAPSSVISPVDGRVYTYGHIDEETIVQAKGIDYTIAELLADKKQAETFLNGSFMIIYLSPRDYHRIHSPVAGEIDAYRYIPGTLLPVNPPSVAMFPRLFVENERLTSYIQHPQAGCVALVKVGATNVGRIRLSYEDFVTNTWTTPKSVHTPVEPAAKVEKGGEVGMFELGSTVILLFEEGVTLNTSLQAGEMLQLGQVIGHFGDSEVDNGDAEAATEVG